MQVTFQSSSGAAISSSQQGGVLAADRGSATLFLGRFGSVSVPVGTRSILVRLTSVRASGSFNDGYADNFAVVLSSGTPLPSPPPSPALSPSSSPRPHPSPPPSLTPPPTSPLLLPSPPPSPTPPAPSRPSPSLPDPAPCKSPFPL